MKPDLYIRADGNEQIGLGHLVRCSALAHMLKNDFTIIFFCRSIPKSLEKEFNKLGFKVKHLNDEKDFLTSISDGRIVVLDGYNFNTDYQKRVRETGCKLVCIDDLHDREFVADLIINHTPGITPKDYQAQPYTCFALGPEYALLRPSFLEQAKKVRKIKKIETLLISFGGADPKGLTKKTLRVALEFNTFKKIIVVTGAAYEANNDFMQLLSADQRIEHRHALTEEQMLETMLEADLAILPASGILLEALATGCMVISGRYVENQKLVYENYKNAGLFIDADKFGPDKIRKAINHGLTQSRPERIVIEGNTKERIIKIFKEMLKESLIKLRDAVKDDMELTFKWATNKDIRRYSFQQHQITRPEHASWFFGKISNPTCIFLIGETKRKPFGSIRFDIEGNEAIISFLVDPKLHGQGLGLLLLKKGIEIFLGEKGINLQIVNSICGIVLKPNITSYKVFERLGFEKVEYADKYKFMKKT